MKVQGEVLYQTMLADINFCNQRGLDPVIETELCFEISNKYWAILRDEVGKLEFESEEEEIHFFKELKPLFICLIEFYGLLYHAQLFKKDVRCPAALQKFLVRESQRLTHFIDDNGDFYQYYKNGETNMDKVWFVRGSDPNGFSNIKSHDIDFRANACHDYLVGKLLALEKYQEYVRKEMGNMELERMGEK